MASLIEKFRSDEGNFLGPGIAWTSSLAWFSVLGYVFGTMVGMNKIDAHDIGYTAVTQRGLTGLGIGFVVGILVALLITIVYPRYTARDAEEWENRDHHHDDHGHH